MRQINNHSPATNQAGIAHADLNTFSGLVSGACGLCGKKAVDSNLFGDCRGCEDFEVRAPSLGGISWLAYNQRTKVHQGTGGANYSGVVGGIVRANRPANYSGVVVVVGGPQPAQQWAGLDDILEACVPDQAPDS